MYLTFDLNIIEGCNLKCSYCFEPSKNITKISSDIISQFSIKIDEILQEKWFYRKFKGSPFQIFDGIKINFWGGEPSLNPKTIEYFFEKYKENNAISFLIYTNGVYFMNEFKNILLKSKDYSAYGNIPKIIVQISYDGFFLTNKNRKHRKNIETANDILNNINWLYENNIPFTIKSTLTPYDFEYLYDSYLDIKQLIKKYKINTKYFPTIDYLNDYIFSSIELEKLNNILENQLDKILYDEHLEFQKNGRTYFKWTESWRSICNAGNTLFGIDLNGNVYKCHGEFYLENSELININDTLFTKKLKNTIFSTWDILNKESNDCLKCNVRYCQRCPIKTFQNSNKKDLNEKYFDFACRSYVCEWNKIIEKIKIKYSF